MKKYEVSQNEKLKHLTNAEKVKTEIGYRFNHQSKKYDLKLNDLSDYQILEIYQNKNLDVEFTEILEKVTALALLSSLGRKPVKRMIKCASKALKRDKFFENLQKIVIDRDINYS